MRKRLPLLLPLIMLALAALACDQPDPNDYQPLRVTRLEADRSAPGKAYILVEGYQGKFAFSSTDKLAKAYETDNYGERWQPSTRAASELPENPQDNLSLRSDGERLMIDSRTIWQFPRRQFRSFFVDDDFGMDPFAPLRTFTSRYNSVSPADPDVIWVIIPEQGVLVGPNPGRPTATRTWRLTNAGIDLLYPLPLTLKHPLAVVVAVVAALIVPPLALLHTYVMSRVYRYSVDPANEHTVRRQALIASGLITAFAAAAITIWLVVERVEYFEVVGPMVILAAVISTYAAVTLARANGKTKWFTFKLAVAAVLASLVIPIGVILTPVGWFIILPLLVCYEVGVRLMRDDYLRRRNRSIPRWQIDLFAIGFTIVALVLVVLLVVLVGFALSFPPLFLLCLGPIVIMLLVLHFRWRQYMTDAIDTIVALIAAGVISTVAVFVMIFAEMIVYGIFIKLAQW